MSASVLIIDADEAFAQSVAEGLHSCSVEASTTGDGKLGLDLARINLPSAIVLCVELPRMSGYSVCAKLKKDDALKSVPVVITSSEATPETFEQHRKLKSRAEEYLKKPIEAREVVDVLRPYLGFETPEEVIPISNPDGSPMQVSGEDEALSVADAASLSADVEDLSQNQSELDQVFDALSQDGLSALEQGATADIAPEPMAAPESEPPSANNDGSATLAVDELAALRAQVEELQRVRDELQAAKEEAERERDAAKSAEKEALEQASSRPSHIASAGSHISSRDALELKKQRNALERQVIDLKEQINQKEKDALTWHEREEALEARIVELEELADGAVQEKVEAEAKAQAAAEELAASVKERDELQTQLQDMSTKSEVAEKANTGIQADLLVAQEETEQFRRQLEETAHSLSAANKQRDELEQQNEAEKREVERLKNEVAAVTAEAETLRQQMHAKGNDFDSVQEKLQVLTKTQVALEQRLEASEAARAESQANLVAASTRMKDEGAKRGKALKALEIGLQLLKESGLEAASEPPPPPMTGDLTGDIP